MAHGPMSERLAYFPSLSWRLRSLGPRNNATVEFPHAVESTRRRLTYLEYSGASQG